MRSCLAARRARRQESRCALSAQIDQRIVTIQDLSRQISSEDQRPIDEVLGSSNHLLRDFDGGLAVFDLNGTLLASIGDHSLWEALVTGSGTNINTLFPIQSGQVRVSDAFPNPATQPFITVSFYIE
jgi:hypothetical protein